MAKKKRSRPTRPRTEAKVNVRRACILTGGGDAPGLNAVLRAFVKTSSSMGIEVLGSEDGFTGLVENRLREMTPATVQGTLPRGGSILGCSNRANPFAYPIRGSRGKEQLIDVSDKVVTSLEDHAVDVLVLVGGDGTMSMGKRFMDMGVPVIGVPKTIDNDLDATELTFGFDTAVGTATWAIDALHTTAEAHDRVMILELMGRYAGWIALCAGIAGGADVILIPEIPYDIKRVVRKIQERLAAGRTFSILVIGEGALPKGGKRSHVTKAKKGHLPRLGGAGARLAAELEGKVPCEIRTTVLGHLQRGGTPSSLDRLLGTRFGVAAAQLCAAGRVGRMVALSAQQIISVPLEAALGKPKLVPPDGELVAAARAVGIEMGG